MYKQSIIFFGLIIPILIGGVIIGGCLFLKGRISVSLAEKSQHYTGYEQSRLGALEIEAMIGRQRPHLDRWDQLVGEEPISALSTNLRAISENLPSKEIQQTFLERMNQAGGFGNATAQKSSGVQFSLRGTFRTVQQALLELETQMPNLQLQSLKIEPSTSTETDSLNFQLTYTAWEK